MSLGFERWSLLSVLQETHSLVSIILDFNEVGINSNEVLYREVFSNRKQSDLYNTSLKRTNKPGLRLNDYLCIDSSTERELFRALPCNLNINIRLGLV